MKDNAGATPLHYAVAVKAIEFIDALGKVGINVNAKNSAGLTPLHLASFFYFREVISTLIKAGADVNARDNEAMTPLHYATGALASGMSELLNADTVDSLIDAVAEIGATISVLAAAGADVNAKSKEGMTPLHCAAATNNIPGHTALTALIVMGADVNALGRDGTPLHCAAAVNNVSAVEALFEAGANIRAKDKNGRLPVFAAASNNANEVVEILTKAGTGLSAVAKFDAAVLSGRGWPGKFGQKTAWNKLST